MLTLTREDNEVDIELGKPYSNEGEIEHELEEATEAVEESSENINMLMNIKY